MIGVASILPFIAVLTNPGIIETNLILNTILTLFYYNDDGENKIDKNSVDQMIQLIVDEINKQRTDNLETPLTNIFMEISIIE